MTDADVVEVAASWYAHRCVGGRIGVDELLLWSCRCEGTTNLYCGWCLRRIAMFVDAWPFCRHARAMWEHP